MESPEMTAIVHRLKGAAASCLIALWAQQNPVDLETLVWLTGYSRPTLVDGMHTLLRLGLIVVCDVDGDEIMWQSSEKMQALLKILATEGKKEDAPASDFAGEEYGESAASLPGGNFFHRSSSYNYNNRSKQTLKEQLQPLKPPIEVEKISMDTVETLPDEPELRQVYDWLRESGVPDTHTVRAILGALGKGLDGAQIRDAVLGWLAYAASPLGKGIEHPGYYTAKRIRSGLSPP